MYDFDKLNGAVPTTSDLKELILMGLTNTDIAKLYGISPSGLRYYINKYHITKTAISKEYEDIARQRIIAAKDEIITLLKQGYYWKDIAQMVNLGISASMLQRLCAELNIKRANYTFCNEAQTRSEGNRRGRTRLPAGLPLPVNKIMHGGSNSIKCECCKKERYVWSALDYAYKIQVGKNIYYFCSWSCMRQFEKEYHIDGGYL